MMITAEIAVTSFHPGSFGGGILIGRDRHNILQRVQLPAERETRPPAIGETWRVIGEVVVDPTYGEQIRAVSAFPLAPTGANIRHWLATSRSIEGVGPKTAEKLWNRFGHDLHNRLRSRDIAALQAVVGPLAAFQMAQAYAVLLDEAHALEWFDRLGVEPSVAILACRLWGGQAVHRVTADPYALCAAEPWTRVDERAQRLGVPVDDDRRLNAAILEAAARRYMTRGRGMGGHLASSTVDLIEGARKLLRCDRATARLACELAASRGEIKEQQTDLWQTRAQHLMERSIEKAIWDRQTMGPRVLPADLFDNVIHSLQDDADIRLDNVQRIAIEAALSHRFAVIAGGAGTGKSTITKGILMALKAMGRPYVQMALSGRAAKRLVEATRHPAMTIYRFLKAARFEKLAVRDGLVLIDETSMIGTPDLWQILSWLPADVDVVLVGDPAQLPPISAGNPLKAIVESGNVSVSTLQVIHRQGPESAIPTVAGSIRAGGVPKLPSFDISNPPKCGVSLLACKDEQLRDFVLAAFGAIAGPPPRSDRELAALHGAGVQILGATLKGPHGVEEIAAAVEKHWMAHRPKIHNWGVAEGSKILWRKNVYDRPLGLLDGNGRELSADIMNGAIGVIERATADGAVVAFDDIEQTRTVIGATDLYNFVRGWAFTVHKAQGSAFDHVIIPLSRSRLLDRNLIYTAITRARKSVVLVGDSTVLCWAVERMPSASGRAQTLSPARHH